VLKAPTTDFLVFLDLIMGKGDSRWGFIHVGNGDGEGLLDEEPSRIGATHTDAVRSIRLEIERFRRLQRIAGDSEGSVVVVSVACHQRVMVRIGAIWIAGGESADGRPGRLVLGNRVVGEGDVRGGLVDVRDGDGEGYLEVEGSLVGGAHADVVRLFRLEVEDGSRPQFVAGNGEGGVVRRAGADYQRVRVRATVRVGGAEGTHNGPGRLILGNRILGEGDGSGRLI
jgi:hypothetical protein